MYTYFGIDKSKPRSKNINLRHQKMVFRSSFFKNLSWFFHFCFLAFLFSWLSVFLASCFVGFLFSSLLPWRRSWLKMVSVKMISVFKIIFLKHIQYLKTGTQKNVKNGHDVPKQEHRKTQKNEHDVLKTRTPKNAKKRAR